MCTCVYMGDVQTERNRAHLRPSFDRTASWRRRGRWASRDVRATEALASIGSSCRLAPHLRYCLLRLARNGEAQDAMAKVERRDAVRGSCRSITGRIPEFFLRRAQRGSAAGCASGMRLLGPALACWCVSSVSASGYRFDAIQSKRGVQHADIQPLLSDNAVVGLIMMLFLVLFCFGKQ